MINKGDELFDMWADVFKLFSVFSEVPEVGDQEYWDKLIGTARQLAEEKYKNSSQVSVFRKLEVGVINALAERYKLKHGGQVDEEIRM